MSNAAALVIGVDDIPQKEQMVLRSLVRLLDGRLGSRLSFSESLRECNVVFASDGPQPPQASERAAVVVRVLRAAGPAHGAAPDGLSIQPPLRMTNVMDALRACADAIGSIECADAAWNKRPGLVGILTTQPVSAHRSCEAYLLEGDERMLVDFRNDRVHAALPLQALVDGQHKPTLVQWSAAQEDEARRLLPAHRLRDLLWSAAHRLGREPAPTDLLAGRYRLLRWPDAGALRQPGFPRLAALLTNRALDVAGACEASGISLAGVHWFLKVSLALGIAVPVEGQDSGARQTAPSTPVPGALRSVIGRLRERLKLW